QRPTRWQIFKAAHELKLSYNTRRPALRPAQNLHDFNTRNPYRPPQGAANARRDRVMQRSLGITPINTLNIPRHAAIIMDGNGRWAKSRGLPRLAGHEQGVSAVKNCVSAAMEMGIEYLTVYAFSSENWSRPVEEVRGLMRLLKLYFRREAATFAKKGVK